MSLSCRRAARAVVLVVGVLLTAAASPGQPALRFIGEVVLPTGIRFAATEVGGLSGIDYDRDSDTFLVISDDRSRRGPARFYRIAIDLADGRLDDGDLRLVAVTALLGPDGEAYGPGAVDPEAIRQHPSGRYLYWASEGDPRSGLGPQLVESDADGRHVRLFALPVYYEPGDDAGVRQNRAFESLALAPHGERLWVALENALRQDGPRADLERGSPVRVLQFDRVTGRPLAETVYLTEPVPHDSLPLLRAPTNGLVELLAIDDGRLLAMERAFAAGYGVTVRLFETRLDGADDVLGRPGLESAVDLRMMPKRLLLDLGDIGVQLDNLEGMTWGPTLPNGARSLILVSDNNFNGSQFTQFLAFEWRPAAH